MIQVLRIALLVFTLVWNVQIIIMNAQNVCWEIIEEPYLNVNVIVDISIILVLVKNVVFNARHAVDPHLIVVYVLMQQGEMLQHAHVIQDYSKLDKLPV